MWNEHWRHTDYLKQLPVRESALVQLGAGALDLRSIDVRGKDAFLIRFRTSARSIWTMVPEKEWIGFLVPLRWTNEYILNGLTASSTTVFKLDGSKNYDVAAYDRDAVTVGIRRSALGRAVRSLSGVEDAAREAEIQRIDMPLGKRRSLGRLLLRCMGRSMELSPQGGFFRMPSAMERYLISEIAEFFIDVNCFQEIRRFEGRSDLRIVREVIAEISRAGSACLSIADICESAGVQKSRLYEAFSEVYNITPGEYMYRHRLTQAREDLIGLKSRPRSVKDTAIKHGFLSSGQFAKAYCSMFGELPSRTLAG